MADKQRGGIINADAMYKAGFASRSTGRNPAVEVLWLWGRLKVVFVIFKNSKTKQIAKQLF